ncbi:MAG: hypothetical protein F4227_02250 [Gammaproteobacteria bacterium]|nr:hypothetical protein [Gammaproteobacteria bacterium]MYF01821.1 hypothetical protein [Gammaproteobacteria bacterium]
MNKDKELEEVIARAHKLIKPLTEEQREFVRKMEKHLPDLEKRLKERRESPDLNTLEEVEI